MIHIWHLIVAFILGTEISWIISTIVWNRKHLKEINEYNKMTLKTLNEGLQDIDNAIKTNYVPRINYNYLLDCIEGDTEHLKSLKSN